MKKEVPVRSRPTKSDKGLKESRNPDHFVSGSNGKMKRLTLDISEELHRRIKMKCVSEGVIMADRLREILDREFL